MAYMAKRTQKRQNAIITLSDQNHKQLEDIHRKKEELLAEFNDRQTELKNQLLEKEGELSKLNKDIAALWECKHLQQEQMSHIKELEKEVMEMRAKHSESLQSIKAHFLHEKVHNEKQSRQRVQALAVEASREASRCLVEHTHSIEVENRLLRQELLHLIHQTQVLHIHQGELEEQRQQLLRERQYVEDLKRLRAQRHFHSQPPGGAGGAEAAAAEGEAGPRVAPLVETQPHDVQGESYSMGSCPGCAELLFFAGDSKGSVTLALALLWVWEAKSSGTASPHHAAMNPGGQVPRADTCRACLCPPEHRNTGFIWIFVGSVHKHLLLDWHGSKGRAENATDQTLQGRDSAGASCEGTLCVQESLVQLCPLPTCPGGVHLSTLIRR
ncbi:CC166 protein, partial [Polyodon spathula]|nr:CC166 protein [Polyodon spathula]